ncbi:MAG: AI-2E family transporter [Acidocella sp.]|nr:AI-2E family transporter [Acidocella sp.]
MNTSDPLPDIEHQNASRISLLTLAAAIIGGLVICALLAVPFFGALTWAFTLAVLFSPIQEYLEKKLHYSGIAAIVTVLVAIIVVAAPTALVVERLVHGAISSAAFIQSKLASGTLQLPPAVGWIEQQIDLPGILNQLISVLSNAGASFVRGSFTQGIEILLTFYILFYFLRDRHTVSNVLRDILPLTPEETGQFFRRMIDTVHAIVYGTLMVAMLQGALAGLMFWALGLPAPLFWGVAMSLLSIIPVLGAFVVWIPEAVYLALEGHEVKAVVLALWGALVVGEVDNIVRPILVGNRLKLHTVPTFIAIIGGLILFGAPGFVLGPMAVTVTLFLLSVFRQRAVGPGA